MLTVTPPLALTSEHVWVLVSSPTGAVDAARIAHAPGTDRFIALPCLAFNTTGLFPAFLADGELVPGFRWATVADIDAHAHLFAMEEYR